MFPNSSIALKFACGVKKCSYGPTSFFSPNLLLYLMFECEVKQLFQSLNSLEFHNLKPVLTLLIISYPSPPSPSFNSIRLANKYTISGGVWCMEINLATGRKLNLQLGHFTGNRTTLKPLPCHILVHIFPFTLH